MFIIIKSWKHSDFIQIDHKYKWVLKSNESCIYWKEQQRPRLSAARHREVKRNVMMHPGGALLYKYDVSPHLMAKAEGGRGGGGGGISLQHFGAYLFIF